ncbi:MAG: hypothetical protein OSA48_11875 [Akkermansiaceae bacterium]|nr:hypothetical protein [Akkermansiaceae bacterium]
MSSTAPGQPYRLQAFHVGCWVLGLIAFGELVALGVALGLNNQQLGRTTVVERVEYVPFNLGAAVSDPAVPVPPVVSIPVPTVKTPAFKPTPAVPAKLRPLNTPRIADPVVERLVREAQAQRVGGDIKVAIAKLDAASELAPEEPNVLYQFAEVYEAIGVYDKAEDYYQKVFELGTLKAGGLYELAAHKLAHGFVLGNQMEGKLALGRVRRFPDKQAKDGERVILSIPVLSAPGQAVDSELLKVSVSFYDKLKDEVVQASSSNRPETRWVSVPVDWQNGAGEELLRVTYFIPAAAEQDLHLFGQRKYFGHLVELSYEGEVIDTQAWPRTLAQKVNARDQDPLFLPDEFIPPDFNPDNPLLPPLPQR